MRNSRFICVALAGLLAACATAQNPSMPRVARLPAEEAARLTASKPALSADDLLAMARSGASPDAIITRFRQANVRLDLTPQQVVDLHSRGLPMPVLQAVHEDRERALRNELAQQLVQRDQQCSVAVDRERARALHYGYPYRAGYAGGWGGVPYRRNGLLWGW